jgi:hypothetical protein
MKSIIVNAKALDHVISVLSEDKHEIESVIVIESYLFAKITVGQSETGISVSV